MRFARLALPLLLMISLAGCASAVGDIVVPVPPHVAATTPSALSAAAPMTIDVRDLREAGGTGVLPGRIGERKTIGDLSMGLVTVTPLPGRIVSNALKAELRAAGYRVGADGASAVIGGGIQQFEIHTDVTALYWDVIGTTAVSVTVTKGALSTTNHYTATCKERTYVWPSGDLIARVVGTCIDDIARQFRADTKVAQVLRG